MKGFQTFAVIGKKHKELTASVLAHAIKSGFFPGAKRRGKHQHYLPDDEVEKFIAFKKLPRSEQIRTFYNDRGLMTAEEVSMLIGIGVSCFSKYRKQGLLPEPRFESFCRKHAYHIDDVMAFLIKNDMLYDSAFAEKFGWNPTGNDAQNSESENAEFNPMLHKEGLCFGNKKNS